MPNLDPQTLAEGRRRLEKYGESEDCWTPLDQWQWEHRYALLSAAEQASKAEACLRALRESLLRERDRDADSQSKGFLVEYHRGRKTGFECAIAVLESIADRHGFDLGEQT